MYLAGRIKDVGCNYVKRNCLVFLGVIFIFILGVVSGSVAVKSLTLGQKKELIECLSLFMTCLARDNIENPSFLAVAVQELKSLFCIWLMGITVIGLPFALLILLVKGFIIGFTVGFLTQQMIVKGIIFAVLAVLPHNLLAVPVYIVASAAAVSFSFFLLKKRLQHKKHSVWPCFLGYSFFMLLLCSLLILSIGFEVYVTPALMKLISHFSAGTVFLSKTSFI